MSNVPSVPENYDAVRAEIIELLQAARRVAARSINSLMTATYWEIGRRIVEYEQKGEARADYGQQLVEQLANDLSHQFGHGFGRANLWQTRAFYRAWPEPKILQTASGESLTAISFNNIDALPSDISTLAARFPLPSATTQPVSLICQDQWRSYCAGKSGMSRPPTHPHMCASSAPDSPQTCAPA